MIIVGGGPSPVKKNWIDLAGVNGVKEFNGAKLSTEFMED